MNAVCVICWDLRMRFGNKKGCSRASALAKRAKNELSLGALFQNPDASHFSLVQNAENKRLLEVELGNNNGC